MPQNVGGTSGNASGSTNTLGLNLGGLNVAFDLGPSTDTVANQAYKLITTSFSDDANLLGQTVIGSQSFLNGLAQPVLDLAANEQQFNTTNLPQMFTSLNQQNFTLGEQAVQADTHVADASIAASNASASEAENEGGGCYITTAVCTLLGLGDDCEELQTLRSFRDTYMQETPERSAMVDDYYATAPSLMRHMEYFKERKAIFARWLELYIRPAVACIRRGANDQALQLYSEMLAAAQRVRADG
jgi:hypothetical protein